MLFELDAEGPLYRQVYRQLKSAILTGRFAPGSKLPSTRALAGDLGVSRNTVILAYEQLLAEGYILGRPRSGTAVAPSIAAANDAPQVLEGSFQRTTRCSRYSERLSQLPLPRPAGTALPQPTHRLDFRYGLPAIEEFPHETWRRLLARRARRASLRSLGYGPPEGFRPLREALAEYLRRARGMMCRADQILIVNGSQQALDLTARLLLDPGDVAVIEEPNYPGARLAFQAIGARLHPIRVDAEGLEVTKLGKVVGARLAYVTPSHQFPTGAVMPLGRRLALLSWAVSSGAWVIEDDYDSEYRYQGPPLEPLHVLDRTGSVIYVGTFSKVLFPALRLGYLVLPDSLMSSFARAKWLSDRHTATLEQETLADFISEGHFERHVHRARARIGARREALLQALRDNFGDRIEIAGESTGVHLLVWLNDIAPLDLDDAIARAAASGIGVYPIAPYYLRPPRRAGLLMGYGSLTEANTRAAIRQLARIL